MIYDISTTENCFNTIQDMTDFLGWEDIFKNYCNKFMDEPDRMRKEIMNSKSIKIKDLIDNDIFFILMHITTSAEECYGISKSGLHDLVWTLKHDTELRMFLSKYNITIDIDKSEMVVDGNKYKLQNDIKQAGGVGYKIFNDPYVCGCFQLNRSDPYGGQVHNRPEIISNINRIIKGIDLEYAWMKTHKPYIVKFTVPYSKMMIALMTSMKDQKEVILQTMFNYAFNTIFYNDFSSHYIGILNRYESVPPEDIISIEKY